MSEDWDDDEPASTGHDIHFLERLNERVDYDRADLALRLYRDPEFVRSMVGDEHPHAERVAVAIDEGALAPHLIVERGGAFVTCLAAGMRVDDTPVVSWERLQVHLGRAALHAERTARANEVLKNQRAARALLEGVHHAGARLSREHVAQLAALAPLLERYYLVQLCELFPRVVATAPHVIRLKHASSAVETKLHRFWNRYHAVGHFLVLATLGGKRSFSIWEDSREQIEERRAQRAARGEPAPEFDPWRGIYLEPAKLGRGFIALRSYWALGRAGRLAVSSLKRQATEATILPQWMHAAYALLAIGKRHRDLRGELSRAVGPAKLSEPLRAEQSIVGWAGYLQELMEGEWIEADASAEAREARIKLAAETIVAQRERGLKEEQPGDDLSTARLAYLKCDFTDLKEDHAVLGLAVALTASLPAEQLYFPATDLALAPAFDGEAAIALARFAPPPPTQVRTVEKPGRNAPCPCGSGKKYKLCCGIN